MPGHRKRRNAGATRVTSARVDRRILRQAVAAPQATCTAILQHVQDTLDHSISNRTISRRLVANGLHSCRPLRRLPLTPPNRRQRLEWCRARSTDSRRVRVWRRRGESSNPAVIVERPTMRRRGIMVWGAIAYDSRSPLLRIQGTMMAQRYVDDVLRPVTLSYLQGVPNALYQQDNARPHTARISQQALQDVRMLPWPPYSPDLSPIEHVWDINVRRLHALPQPRSKDELWQMVEREWRAIPQDAIRTLIDSLPRRVAACIAVRVCGILNEEIQSMLLMNSMLTFEVAQEMALAHEAAVKNVAEIKNGKPQEEMNVMGRAVKMRLRDEKRIFKCFRCGNTNHREEQCFFKDKRCFKCQKLGHISRVCKNRNWRSDRNNYSIDEEAEATNGLFNVNQVKDTSNMRNYMEQEKNIISEKTYIETWVKSERPRIEKDATKLVQWNRQRLSILGKIRADVKVNKRNITMELLVVEGPGPNLIGREAFDQIGIGLEWINYGDSVCQITEEFMDVFKDNLGQYRGPPIHLKIKTLGKPTFLRARTLPYAIRP
ncbi:K02A2.6-like [Cordylochernes scorpioides]|uniref:K02A2.6-like n=1 Tax=Cordylochernes scorpioides TaxID=51811 RepID=A0ABY6KUU1_9ARAC|nr:K02A2.6-like [Cordylochernes scorpioides]